MAESLTRSSIVYFMREASGGRRHIHLIFALARDVTRHKLEERLLQFALFEAFDVPSARYQERRMSEIHVPPMQHDRSTVTLVAAVICLIWYIVVVSVCTLGYVQM